MRGLCCQVSLPGRCIIIDPGVALGYSRHGLMPHPAQIAVGRRIRGNIIDALKQATDVVFSHFHGDHIPLKSANPFQLSIDQLPDNFSRLRAWSLSAEGQHPKMQARFNDLATLMGGKLRIAEGVAEGPLSFSQAVPHGSPDSGMGKVMMTRVEMGQEVFVYASDIQLLDDATIDLILAWQPDIVLAAGPPLYLDRLAQKEQKRARNNALRLGEVVPMLILDHHLMRSSAGPEWLDMLSAELGKQLFCVADFMHQPRRLLEADRVQLYESMPVPEYWHEDYFSGKVNPEIYWEQAVSQGWDSLQ
ncbi:MAG: hypothetical protein U9N50_02335 [Pseudomonadota bacterium]|nr:hypothetical protein [Pseudomonadota bacterium]